MLNLIIENLINKNEKNLDFNFTKSIKENIQLQQKDLVNNLPIAINKSNSEWENIHDNEGEKLVKIYHFNSHKHMMYFVNEYLGQIKLLFKVANIAIKNMSIQVILFTEDIMQVSEQDLELAKYLDDIYNDIMFIRDL